MTTMKDYRTIVVGTDGSALAEPTVARAAWLAQRDDADLVIVCAYAESAPARRGQERRHPRRRHPHRPGARPRCGRAGARGCRGRRQAEGATVTAALLIDGEPATALVTTAEERNADLIVLGALHDRTLADRLLGTVATEVLKRAVRRADRPTGQRCRRIGGPGGRRPGMTRPAASHRHARPGGALVLDDRAPALNRRAAGARPETLNWRARSSPVQHRLNLVSAPHPTPRCRAAWPPPSGPVRPETTRNHPRSSSASVQPFLVSSACHSGVRSNAVKVPIRASRWLIPGGAMMPRQLAKTTSIPDSVRVGASRFGTRVPPDTASTRSCPDRICSVYSRTPDAAKVDLVARTAGSNSPPPS